MQSTLIVALVVLMAAPAVSAQSLTQPAEDHADEKVARATGQPVRFLGDQASPEGVGREAEWGVAYACYGIDHLEREHGTPDPELEQCEDYEQALGIDEPKEEPVAVAENLTEDPVEEAQTLADDAVTTVQEIVEEPETAVERLVALLKRALSSVGRILGGVVLLALQALGVGLNGAADLAHGALGAVELAGFSLAAGTQATSSASSVGVDALWTVFGAVGEGASALGSAIGQGISAIGNGVSHASSAVGRGLGSAGSAVGDAAASIGEAIGDAWDSLFGGNGAQPGSKVPVDAGDAPVETDSLGLPDVGRILEDLR